MDLHDINRRRQEVTDLIGQAKRTIADGELELRELDIAEKVLLRLTGAERPPSSAADEPTQAEDARRKPDNLPPVPVMILKAMRDLGHLTSVKPKDVRNQIASTVWPEIKADRVATQMWRMAERHQLVKDGAGYSLPRVAEAPDTDPSKEASEASLFQPSAQGREADAPGGSN